MALIKLQPSPSLEFLRVCLVGGFWRGGIIRKLVCLVQKLEEGRGGILVHFKIPPKVGGFGGEV